MNENAKFIKAYYYYFVGPIFFAHFSEQNYPVSLICHDFQYPFFWSKILFFFSSFVSMMLSILPSISVAYFLNAM